MKDFLMTTYTIALPVILGYIVWILKQQRKERIKDGIERDKRIMKRSLSSNWRIELKTVCRILKNNGIIFY